MDTHCDWTNTQIDPKRARRRDNLKRMLRPRHIAFIGGRAVEASIALCQNAGFDGEIWAVHPKYKTLAGVPCVPSVADLPKAPDAALLALSRERTVDMVAQLSAVGAGGAVSITGEFAESDDRGVELQLRLEEAAGDMALVGPNCLGVMNLFDGVAVWGGDNVFNAAPDQGVALISQSGYVAYAITNVELAFPLGYAISIGNQAVLDAGDYVEVLLDDDRVRAIGLYLEGIVDVAALSQAALKALQKGVALVVLKAGGTQESAGLTKSHSGTLAVPNVLWSALFQRLGMVEVGSPKALIETLKLLGMAKAPIGNRLVCGANSGGYTALIAEKGRALGLDFPAPTEAQRAALRDKVPDLVFLSNPLDYNLPWASMHDPETANQGFDILIDDRCDLLVYFIDYPLKPSVGEAWMPTLEGLIRLNVRSATTIAIASVLPDGLPPALRNKLHEAGLPTLQGLDDAMAAISAAACYHTIRDNFLGEANPAARLLPTPGPMPSRAVLIDEAQGKQRLAAYGLTVPKGVTGTADKVSEAAAEIGFPVALKLLNSDLAHKNRAGAVVLNLDTKKDVEVAIETIRKAVTAYDPSLCNDHFLVESMVSRPRAEFIVGIKQEPGLGLALVLGSGGTEVEALRNFATLLLPANDVQILAAINGLDLTRQLKLDDAETNALLKAVHAITHFAEENRDTLLELDVNPLILDEKGGVTAVDALICIMDKP